MAQLLLLRDASRTLKFGYDCWYVRHRTLALDITLLSVSMLVTFRARWETSTSKPVLGTLRARIRCEID